MDDNLNKINQSYVWAYHEGWNITTLFSFFNDFNRTDIDIEYVEFGVILFLCLCSFIMNLFLIVFFVTKKELRTVQHMFTVSIMLSSLILLPFAMLVGSTRLSVSGWTYGSAACSLTIWVLITTAFVKIWLMTLISVDRYLRVVHSHHRYIGRRLSMLLMAVAWILPAATLFGMTIPNSETKYIEELYGGITICTVAFPYHPTIRYVLIYFSTVFLIEFVLPATIMIVCYVRIMKKINRSTAKLLKHSQQAQTKLSLSRRTADRSLRSNIRRRRTTIILITIVALFLFMWLPLFGLLAAITLDEVLGNFQMTSRWVIGQLCVLLLNTMVEPFLYSFTTSKVRNELKRTLQRLRPSKHITSTTSTADDTSTQLHSSES